MINYSHSDFKVFRRVAATLHRCR